MKKTCSSSQLRLVIGQVVRKKVTSMVNTPPPQPSLKTPLVKGYDIGCDIGAFPFLFEIY